MRTIACSILRTDSTPTAGTRQQLLGMPISGDWNDACHRERRGLLEWQFSSSMLRTRFAQRPDNSRTSKSSREHLWPANRRAFRSGCFRLRQSSSRPTSRVRPRRRPAPAKADAHSILQWRRIEGDHES